MLEGILDFTKTLITSCTKADDYVIDATVGNGNDTLFLAKLVKNGHVYGFDIQEKAIENTKALLKEHDCSNVTLYNIGHENMADVIPKEIHEKIACGIFNLGYLPRGNKALTTKTETTLEAVKQLLNILKVNGLAIIVIYPGHDEGMKEKKALLEYVKTLNQKQYQVLLYEFINQINDAPFLIAIEKIKGK